MTSEAQVLANRVNAAKSTGPRTKIGKAIVAANAIKHGLFAHQDVIAEEDPQQYQEHRQRLLAELGPAGQMETILAGRIVSLTWRLKRAETLANELFDYLLAKELENSLGRFFNQVTDKDQEDMRRYVDTDPAYAVGRMIAKDYRGEETLDRLGMHERRIEGSLYRTMHELDRCRLARKAAVRAGPCARPGQPQGVAPTNEGNCVKQTQSAEVSGSTPALEGDPSRGRLGYMVDGPLCETKPIDGSEAVCSVPVRASIETQNLASPQETLCGVTTNEACPGKQSQSPRPATVAASLLRPRARVAYHYHNTGRSC